MGACSDGKVHLPDFLVATDVQGIMDPTSKLREATGLLRRKFLIDEKVKRFESFYTSSFFYKYLLTASSCIRQGRRDNSPAAHSCWSVVCCNRVFHGATRQRRT